MREFSQVNVLESKGLPVSATEKGLLSVSEVLRGVEGNGCRRNQKRNPLAHISFAAADVNQPRFWNKVDKEGPFSDLVSGRCWVWKASTNSKGYGCFAIRGKSVLAHRVSVILSGREFPPRMLSDHRCRNRRCVNPDHLRVTTFKGNAENTERAQKTHCKHGHPYTPENTIRKTHGLRNCRECQLRYFRNWYRRTHNLTANP